MSEREVYKQLKQMAINEAIAGSGKESIARNVGAQIDKIIDLALTLSANREDYKLVPVGELLRKAQNIRALNTGEYASDEIEENVCEIEAMIGAVDEST